MASSQLTASANQKLGSMFVNNIAMASAGTACNTFFEIKNAYSSAKLPTITRNFNISIIIQYFLQTHADFRSIREVSYELFTNGHVQDIMVKEDEHAKKTLIKAHCLAHMRQLKYELLMILNENAEICHASCRCEDGKGPTSTCKHVAALCYAVEDFVKTFVQPEDILSCTDKLEAWNKPRDVKLPATPIFDIDFQRKRYGRKRKENGPLKGARPETYQLNKVCESDRTAVVEFLKELDEWGTEAGKGILLNTVVDRNDPVETVNTVNPLYEYMSSFQEEMEIICSGPNVQVNEIKERLRVTKDQQLTIQTHTQLQSRLSHWYELRKYRVTGSVAHRVCNYYTYKRANPENICRAIFEPTQFTSAATKLGLDLEPKVLEKYVALKRPENSAVKSTGLIIDTEHGFLAASPDAIVHKSGDPVGLVEVKTKIADKWNTQTIQKCLSDSLYPSKLITVNDHGSISRVIKLKENHQWFHQIQLQLFVCRDFATFCDLAIYHPGSDNFLCSRITPNQEWVNKFLPKMEQFFETFMAPKIIAKHKRVNDA